MEVTDLLNASAAGDKDARNKLFELLHDELHGRVRRRLGGQRGDITLRPTAVLNDIYLKFAGASTMVIKDRKHFFDLASKMMRQIVIDYVRKHEGRGECKRVFLTLDVGEHVEDSFERKIDFLSLDLCLNKLGENKKYGKRWVTVVERRYLLEYTWEQIAEELDTTERTARRDWAAAKAFLKRCLDDLGAERKG